MQNLAFEKNATFFFLEWPNENAISFTTQWLITYRGWLSKEVYWGFFKHRKVGNSLIAERTISGSALTTFSLFPFLSVCRFSFIRLDVFFRSSWYRRVCICVCKRINRCGVKEKCDVISCSVKYPQHRAAWIPAVRGAFPSCLRSKNTTGRTRKGKTNEWNTYGIILFWIFTDRGLQHVVERSKKNSIKDDQLDDVVSVIFSGCDIVDNGQSSWNGSTSCRVRFFL